MSYQYKILRWDAILTGSSITKVPIIYIKPDIAFLEYVTRNNFMIMCKIQGTSTIYDNKFIGGIVYKSSAVPNCRPNFFEESGSYIIELLCTWNGYPNCNNLGYVSLVKPDEYKSFNCGVTSSCNTNCNYNTNDSFDYPECINCKFGTM